MLHWGGEEYPLNYDQHFFLVISKKAISMRIGEIRDNKACYYTFNMDNG